ncbi:MAG TPA: hypothetical protein EYQ52_07650 [Candidatus Thioglobus sp.]|jgi:hypothetical protein|nr:hypothetical protein [Candidatus Thioglobus sp.]
MNKLNTVLLASVLIISTQSAFAGSKMDNPAFEDLSFLDKKDLAQVLLGFKSLPEDVRLSLCNGALLSYLDSQEYSGDLEIVEEIFSEVDDLSQDARLALTQVATKMLGDNGKCEEGMARADKKKRGERGFWSMWNRFWGGGDKKSRN